MVTGSDMPGFAATLRLGPEAPSQSHSIDELAMTVGGNLSPNVLLPAEKATFTLLIKNKGLQRLKASAHIEVIQYGTRGRPGDSWTPEMFRIRETAGTPFSVDIPVSGLQLVTVSPEIPEEFGGYGLVADLGRYGRSFVASLVRVMAPDRGRVQFPSYALDETWPDQMNENVLRLFRKLGVKGARMGASYALDTLPDYAQRQQHLADYLKWAQDNDVTVMLTLDNGSGPMPLGRPRPWLSEDNHFLKTKDDRAWLPEYDKNFQHWVQRVATRWGWPRGPVNAVELWNEPWEGISISGWGADIPRYRTLYEHMAEGVEAARHTGAKVLIGGACSSTNTRDKLFPDGSDKFLKWLDFVSIHYQPLSADPALQPEWVHRKSPYGPVRVWDTESWIANSEEKVAAVIASMRAQGQDRTAGIYNGNVYESINRKANGRTYPVVQAWSPAAAVAATQKFIGQRQFKELLFRNGLPWIFVFRGVSSEEDGTVVVVGDLGGVYEKTRTLFQSVKLRDNARLKFTGSGPFALFDFYGNRINQPNEPIVIPLNGSGYFLRADGTAGSFQALLNALRSAHVDGYDPIEIIARDFVRRIESGPELRFKVTNVLNRAVEGDLSASVGSLQVTPATLKLRLAANETQEVSFRVAGKSSPGNAYALFTDFVSTEGNASHRETLHVNEIAHRTIHVDGNLEDWHDVLPQTSSGNGIAPSLTEQAWLPFKNFASSVKSGVATAYLAYDDSFFYFGAKVADDTPDQGMQRFEKRDDDSFFYPEKSWDGEREMVWPAAVRRFSYRRNFEIPSGNDRDNIQIAFNVLPESEKALLPFPPGTMRHFMVYSDTDYEYALNPVSDEFGGGTEVWRLLAPGMPRKHFYPRQPASHVDGGPVSGAKLVIRREGNTRAVEAAIPWGEIPRVKQCMLRGQTVKFSYRVNNNAGPALELAAGRSVSKENAMAFHDDWTTHWANEIEFSFAK